MLYDYNGTSLSIYRHLAGDGVKDDTAALQALVDSETEIHIPSGLKFKLSRAVTIDTAKCHIFDGGNSQFIVNGDHAGFIIRGAVTGSMTADPSTLTNAIKKDEAGFHFSHCRIYGSSRSAGIGIQITGTFKAIIDHCYMYMLNTGIVLANRNRDMIVNENDIYECECGIHFMPDSDFHQINMAGNHVSYCRLCVYVNSVKQINNWQFCGNDLEIAPYPTGSDFANHRCVLMDDGNGYSENTDVYSEMEFSGNTIQGHYYSDTIIEITGSSVRHIKHISFAGNHISNSAGGVVKLRRVKTLSFAGNTIKGIQSHAYDIADSENIVINGEAMDEAGGVVTVSGTTTNILVANCTAQTTKANPIRAVGDNARLVAKNILINGSEYSGA